MVKASVASSARSRPGRPTAPGRARAVRAEVARAGIRGGPQMRDRVTARRGPSAGAPAGAGGDTAGTGRATGADVAVVALACVALAGILGATVGADLTGCRGCGAERPVAQSGA